MPSGQVYDKNKHKWHQYTSTVVLYESQYRYIYMWILASILRVLGIGFSFTMVRLEALHKPRNRIGDLMHLLAHLHGSTSSSSQMYLPFAISTFQRRCRNWTNCISSCITKWDTQNLRIFWRCRKSMYVAVNVSWTVSMHGNTNCALCAVLL